MNLPIVLVIERIDNDDDYEDDLVGFKGSMREMAFRGILSPLRGEGRHYLRLSFFS